METGTDRDEPQKGGWVRKFLIIVLVPGVIIAGFVIATGGIIAANKKPEEKRRPFTPLAVLAEYAFTDSVQLLVNTQGEARPQIEINLVPEVGGKITYVSPKFIEGGIFKKGDALVQIDKSNYEVAVIRAEAAIARAQQVLVRERAEAEVARKDWEELGRPGEPSDLVLREPQMAEARANLQSAEADLSNARIQLDRTTVKAPFNGRVRTKNSGIGQYVSPGVSLGRIFSTDVVEVRLPLNNDDLRKLDLPIAFVAESREAAPEVDLTAEVGGQIQTWKARIMRTDSTYDTRTRALFAIAEVADPYGKGASDNGVPLAPGLFVDARIAGKSYDSTVVIPRDALRPGNKVYVARQDGSAEIVTAGVLDSTVQYAYITSGVNSGDIVILSPMEESRAVGPLKVLDVKDPKTVFIDPPKPQWLIDKERAGDEESRNGNEKNRRKQDEDRETTSSENSDGQDSAATRSEG